ncbi:Prolyl-tRNA deacylase proX [Raoultella terrigena]|uniref:Prolyl-tRNA deacylase proX n=1 Tax=Raoultella terrigena TaxID=577 RepID=A0A3P8M3Z9_RAOTE|nr:Prolyl-tRNA deacylase proX [Raoultella terrigena]
MNAPEKPNTHLQLLALLDERQARYRLVEHEAVGKCEAVSEIRGTELGQGAKALVCKVKGHGVNQHVLAILAADQQADLARLAQHVGGSKASLASPAEVDALTACVFGAIPPFSFHPALRLVADPLLFENFSEIAFNARSAGPLNYPRYGRLSAHRPSRAGCLSPGSLSGLALAAS